MSGATMDQGPERVTHHVHHDWRRDGAVSETIVDAVSGYEGVEADELPPLDRSVNPEALDHLFDATDVDASRAGSLTFSYSGYVVLVMSTGQILIREPAGT